LVLGILRDIGQTTGYFEWASSPIGKRIRGPNGSGFARIWSPCGYPASRDNNDESKCIGEYGQQIIKSTYLTDEDVGEASEQLTVLCIREL
jgi:hypothetical protein